MKAITKFNQLYKLIDNSYSGGIVPWSSFKLFEKVKPKTPVLYYKKQYGKEEIIIMIRDLH